MKQRITKEEAYKINLINIAKHHRKHCEGQYCNVSLLLLLEMTERLNVKFSDEEKKLFF